MTKVVLIVEYNGMRYHGFQLQRGAPTIQGEIEGALGKIVGWRIAIIAASRTDSGVHARGQVVSFKTELNYTPETWRKALNYYLPLDIAVKDAYHAEDEFNVRRDAMSREYRYYILNSSARSPLKQNTVYFIPKALDIEAMNRACQVLEGRQDFASFIPLGSTTRSTVRTVYKAEVRRKGELVIFDMIANSFLTHQVRATVGGLVGTGLGKMSAETFWEMVRAKRPGTVGPLAPARGLCLIKVNYPEKK
jgi:tRNA pseudouridine38-40 synthase